MEKWTGSDLPSTYVLLGVTESAVDTPAEKTDDISCIPGVGLRNCTNDKVGCTTLVDVPVILSSGKLVDVIGFTGFVNPGIFQKYYRNINKRPKFFILFHERGIQGKAE